MITDCQSVCLLPNKSNSQRPKKLTSSPVVLQHPLRQWPRPGNDHRDLDQTNHKKKEELSQKEKRMVYEEKKKPTNVEEEVNKGKFGIFKKLLV